MPESSEDKKARMAKLMLRVERARRLQSIRLLQDSIPYTTSDYWLDSPYPEDFEAILENDLKEGG